MPLPNNGRIAIIDDMIEESLPLLSMFAQEGVPVLYYDGILAHLPKTPLAGLRFLFLDLDLKGAPKATGTDSVKTMASYAAGVVNRLINHQNGPFVIVFWSKHSKDDGIIKKVLEYCKKKGVVPAAYIDLEKYKCKTTAGEYSLPLISQHLQKKLLEIGAFNLYVEWENLIHSATTEFVRDFSSHIPLDKNWSKETSSLFNKLFETAVVSKSKTISSTEQFKSACNLLNRSFHDTVQDLTRSRLSMPGGFNLESGLVKNETIAKINRSLFLSTTCGTEPASGYIYATTNKKIKDALTLNIFKKSGVPRGCKLCRIIITPECDIKNEKLLCIPGGAHRVVYGLMFPIESDTRGKDKKRTEAQFLIGPFWHNRKIYLLEFHFSALTFQEASSFSGAPLFSVKRDLMFDLQSKAANHVNRLGNFQLS